MRQPGPTLIAACLGLTALGPTAQAQFRTRTDLVEFGAVVLDAHGETVSNLHQDDFEVVEDGHPVAISTFAAIDADNPATVNDGRFLALLVEPRAPTAKKLARQLIERMGERDVVAVLGPGGDRATTTDDRAVALTQLEHLSVPVTGRRFPAGGIGDMPLPVCSECGVGGVNSGYLGHEDSPLLRPVSPSAGFETGYGAKVLNHIESLSDQLKRVEHRRKSIVYIGPGAVLNLTPRAIANGDSGQWFDVMKHASRADVSVSVVSVDGLTGRSYAGARMLAEETGGEAVVDTNLYDEGLTRLWQRTGHHYLLGYTPGGDKRKRHTVNVRVKRPGLEVHALKTRG